MAAVCVIGAGVIGLSTAVAIQERLPDTKVTIIAENINRHTTSYGSGGLVVPVAKGNPEEISRHWCKDSLSYFYDLACSAEAESAGVSLVNSIELTNQEQVPDFLKYLSNVRKMDPDFQKRFSKHFKNGYTFTASLVELPIYLQWMTNKFTLKGGKLIERKVKSLNELGDHYDVVVNCTGLGSQGLVPDPLLKPIRGQTLHIKAPGIKTVIHSDESLHIFPFRESVFIGGVKQAGKTDMTLSPVDSNKILTRAQDIFPPLKNARVLWEWVGLRPHRDSVRLETDIIQTDGKPVKVVHNYGHGSFGIGLSWGCAVHAARLTHTLLQGPQPKL